MKSQKNITNFFKPLSNKRSVSGENNVPLETKKIKCNDDSASNEDKEQLQLLIKNLSVLDTNMGSTWYRALKPEFSKPYFKTLSDFVEKERMSETVYPEHKDVWTWTKLCRLPETKVVILGQDPYHNPGQAHGLCFSVQKGVRPPPSLLNMYKELATDIPGFKSPGHGNLSKWAEQGVLLLNACLTVKKNSPNSHADKGWEKLTDAVIKAVSENNKGVVFLLWGAFAQKKASIVDKNKHHLLKAPHPSPLSASRGFFGCKHFSKCNDLLRQEGKSEIDWNLL